MLNITWININQQDNNKHIIHRIVFIVSIILLFWIGFTLIYLISRLIISNFKRWNLPSVNKNVAKTFVISSNSFRPIRTLNRSDSLFSNINFAVNTPISNYGTIDLIENYDYQQSKLKLIEHYLKTYNPLQIDMIPTSNVKIISPEEIHSETDTHIIDNCYSLRCTNKQTGEYIRLKEQTDCSATFSLVDERLSQCTNTTITVPIVMVTDCSNSQRLHTDIIEMNEDEEQKLREMNIL